MVQGTAAAESSVAQVAVPTRTTVASRTPVLSAVVATIEPTVPPPTSTLSPSVTPQTPTDTPTSPPTATPDPLPTNTLVPTLTEPPPTVTPSPSPTALPQPTFLPTTQPVAESALPTEPLVSPNLLPNPSFEEGHYNLNGIPELQLPNKWRLEWDEGPTGYGDQAWDVYVRPETRVLPSSQLPPEEHGLYIYSGQNTVKIFKGQGAVSFRLLTDITLEPGTYVVEAKMFPDIIERWEGRTKQWPQDPSAAEMRFLVGDGGTFWATQNYGQINVNSFTFTVDELKTIPIGIALRGNYAIANNGWFIDDLSVRRIE